MEVNGYQQQPDINLLNFVMLDGLFHSNHLISQTTQANSCNCVQMILQKRNMSAINNYALSACCSLVLQYLHSNYSVTRTL